VRTDPFSRCRDIHAAATENVASLADAGITPAKLTALKKQIDGFEALHTKPRQNQAKRSAATRRMPFLFEKADRIVNTAGRGGSNGANETVTAETPLLKAA
jgi:hypothetical protein